MGSDSMSAQSGGLSFTREAERLCARQAKGRAVVLEFRELSPAGCCSVGAMVRVGWRSVAAAGSDPDLTRWGEVDGVPVLVHHVVRRFLADHQARVCARAFGPFR
ncbi:MAG: hypothetical protein IT209_08405 [Armatimonadetes bacterium]|nr:hypothetical protein [Armatimonadota bacterium]